MAVGFSSTTFPCPTDGVAATLTAPTSSNESASIQLSETRTSNLDTELLQALMSDPEVAAAAREAGCSIREVVSLCERMQTHCPPPSKLVETVAQVVRRYKMKKATAYVQGTLKENPVIGRTFESVEFEQLAARVGMTTEQLRGTFLGYLRAEVDEELAAKLEQASHRPGTPEYRRVQAGQAVAQLVEQRAVEEWRQNPEVVDNLVDQEMQNPVYATVLARESVKARAFTYGLNAAEMVRLTLKLRATQDEEFVQGLTDSAPRNRAARNQLEFLSHLQEVVDQARNPDYQPPAPPPQARVDEFLSREGVQKRAIELGVDATVAFNTLINSKVDDGVLFRIKQHAHNGIEMAEKMLTMIEYLQFETLQAHLDV